MATPTADIANCSGSSSTDCRPACDRPMSPATRLSSTSRARRPQSSMRRLAWCARRRSSSWCFGRVQSHLCGGNPDAGLYWTGLARTCGCSGSGVRGPCLRCCPTIRRAACTGPRPGDPEVNRSYGAMAAHYGVGILPARPYHPKDKAKAGSWSTRIAQFYLLGRLRNLKVLSRRTRDHGDHRDSGAVERAGDAPSRGQPARELFETIERPVMRPLPDTDHESTPNGRLLWVGTDHHIEVAGFFYSVPHTLIR